MKKRLNICVSGAADTSHCCKNIVELSKEVGKEIARQNLVLLTGATTGAPYYSAVGCKEKNGISIGFSPASTEKEHIKSYKLPIDKFDLIVYTGFNYAGRNLLLTRASDGVIIICGRTGTLNEFTVAFEDDKPVGILEGTGGTADMIRGILSQGYRGRGNVIFDEDPKNLVIRLVKLINKKRNNYT
ncbi:MAG: hypothetical protein Q8O39_02235 [bacterium]|nr:hypothetical protein [bacterium]